MKKVLIQIDGANFYKKVKKVLPNIHLTTYDYELLAQAISKKKSQQIIYYVGEIKRYPGNKRSNILYAGQQSLFSNLSKQNIDIKLGYLLKSDGRYHEKGVDVQIAVDMVRGAIKNEFDICYLISSDSDLLPAVLTAKQERKKIIYVAFENAISHALLKNCSSYIILRKKDIEKFS
ncbi:MAG TPA: NYN domain-containing protein [Candidatus Woesebacteria bacterium]|nr:NYN domain-containing protein [Candidatus Woesebacteria bacterium]